MTKPLTLLSFLVCTVSMIGCAHVRVYNSTYEWESQEILMNDGQTEVRCRGVNDGPSLGLVKLRTYVELRFSFQGTVSVGRYDVPTSVKASVIHVWHPDRAAEATEGFVDVLDAYGGMVADFHLVTKYGSASGSFNANLADSWESSRPVRPTDK